MIRRRAWPVALTLVGLLALAALSTLRARADDGPPWLAAVLARTTDLEAPRTGAVVLEREHRVSMIEPGRLVHHERGAIRITSRDGAGAGVTRVPYVTDGGRVRELKGWVVAPSGSVTRLSSRDETDRAYLGEDLYNEVRVRVLDGGSLPVGSVFAYEWTVEQPEPFTQVEWEFQDESPIVSSRFVLETPPGWRVTTQFVNHAEVEPRSEGNARVWEVAGLTEVRDEPLCPSRESRVARIAVSAAPPSAAAAAAAPAFTSWGEVARWLSDIAARAGDPGPAVRDRAASLVAGARTEMDTLQAVARYVQSLRYASIQMGTSRGGGYQPRPPAQVMARAYGDCKDKANLMRGLLASLGRPSQLLVLYHGDPDYVRADWPSPSPFNHCILAIPTRAARRLPSEVTDEHGARLIVFDPTDPYTPVGDLSTATQGGLALVIAPGTTRLVRLPELAPEASTVTHRIDVTIDETGSATGTITERSIGQAAVAERALVRSYDRIDYRRAVVQWVRRAIDGAVLDSVEVRDDSLGGRFETRVAFRVERYGQLLQNRLLIVHPPLLTRLGIALAADRPRQWPVQLAARMVEESLSVRVPDAFAVDELPDSATVEAPFARYTFRTAADGARVQQRRALTTRRGAVPAGDFTRVKEFYARVRATEDAPIVFARR